MFFEVLFLAILGVHISSCITIEYITPEHILHHGDSLIISSTDESYFAELIRFDLTPVMNLNLPRNDSIFGLEWNEKQSIDSIICLWYSYQNNLKEFKDLMITGNGRGYVSAGPMIRLSKSDFADHRFLEVNLASIKTNYGAYKFIEANRVLSKRAAYSRLKRTLKEEDCKCYLKDAMLVNNFDEYSLFWHFEGGPQDDGSFCDRSINAVEYE